MEKKLLLGNNLEKLRELEDNSIDSIVSDPPYGLSFMNKKWDYDVPSVEFWKEVLRVLKPGGHLLSFGGTRTYHRMTVNIEDAGFEIRDCIQWLYGSGFPKSHNISKSIDKKGGNNNLTTELGEELKKARESRGISKTKADEMFCGGTTLYSWYEGRKNGIQLPTSNYMRKIADAFPELEKYVVLIMEAEREVIGIYDNDMGGLGGERLGKKSGNITISSTDQAKEWEGWGTALKPANEPIVLARKPLEESTVAENVLKYGTGGINIDDSRIGTEQRENPIYGDGGDLLSISKGGEQKWDGSKNIVEGRFPANIILDEIAAEELDKQSGISKAQKRSSKYNKDTEEIGEIGFNPNKSDYRDDNTYGDTGGASRFFYTAKVSKKERNLGLNEFQEKQTIQFNSGMVGKVRSDGTIIKEAIYQKNSHPTVKPIQLMSYLCKLITPPNGTILDPYMGSGSTGIAALLNGFNFVGMEMEEEYFNIASSRIDNYEEYRQFLK